MKYYSVLFSLFLISFTQVINADTVMLLHGYLGSSHDWYYAGIVEQLDSSGWQNAGILKLADERVISSETERRLTRRLYSIELSSEQSIDIQSKQLSKYIEYVRHWHPSEQIILIGHSAGGVVARFYMVREPKDDLSALITIASPHLGTKNAELAQAVSENFLVWLEGLPGVGKLYRSQGLFFDLMPNRSDNLIGWLNYQEHPLARYYSIVREETDDGLQDFIVPSWSQDMNEVYALRGRGKTYRLKGLHGLSKKDGEIIKRILADLYFI